MLLRMEVLRLLALEGVCEAALETTGSWSATCDALDGLLWMPSAVRSLFFDAEGEVDMLELG